MVTSLYNAYRPMSWDAVVGQEGIVETLKNSVIENRIVSAYIFQGPRGTGKTTCARIFAKALNCESPSAPGVPCGQCDNCKDIASDESPNVHEIDAACFHRDVRVRLANGKSMRIGKIVDKKLSVDVLSYNFDKQCVEVKRVIGWHKNGSSSEFYNVKLDSGYGEKRCISGVTLNHGIYNINNKKQPLSDFKVGDEVLYKCSTINAKQKSVLAGTILGDASFKGGKQYVKGNTNLNVMVECSHNESQWDYLRYKSSLFENIGSNVKEKIITSGYGGKFKRFITKTNEYLSRLKDEWMKDGKITHSLIESIDEISLAFWYMDDGTFSDPEKKSALRLCTNGYKEDEVDMLVAHLNNKWGIGAIKSSADRDDRENEFVINIGRAGGKKFFDLIKVYVHPTMYYKLPSEYQGYFHDMKDECQKNEELIPVKINGIEPFFKGRKKEKSFVRYDIEIEDNHNYFVGRGVLVSNSNTGVDDMREMKASANTVANGGGWKVYIIDECHMLSKAAQNSVLKLFEEPPPNTIFILATTELNKVEGTIISRSLRFDFRPVNIEAIMGRLKYICDQEKFISEDAGIKMIAKAANGGMRDSISILERVALENGSKVTVETVVRSLGVTPIDIMNKLALVIQGDCKVGFDIVENVVGNGYDIYQFFQSSVDFFRDMLLLKLGVGGAVLVDAETLVTLQNTASVVALGNIRDAIGILEESMGKYRYAENKRILIEMALYKIAGKKDAVVPVAVTNVVNSPVSMENRDILAEMVRSTIAGMDLSQYVKTTVVNNQTNIGQSPDTMAQVMGLPQNQTEPIQQQPGFLLPQAQGHNQQLYIEQVEVQENIVQQPTCLTEYQWEGFLDRVRIENVDAYGLLRQTQPHPFEGNWLSVSFSSDYNGFFDTVFNENYSHICSKVLSICMGGEWYVKAIPRQVIQQHNQQHTMQSPQSLQKNVEQPFQQQVQSQSAYNEIPQPRQQPVMQSTFVAPVQPQVQQTQSVSQAPVAIVASVAVADDTPVTEQMLFEKFGN